MSNLVQHIDLDYYPTKSIRRQYRRTVYPDGLITYDLVSESDTFYDTVELTEGLYYKRLYDAMEHQRKMHHAETTED